MNSSELSGEVNHEILENLTENPSNVEHWILVNLSSES